MLLLHQKCCCVTCWQAGRSCCIRLRRGRQSPFNSRQRRQAQISCRSSPALSVLQCSSEARRRPWRRVSTKPHSSNTASTLSTCRHRDDNCSLPADSPEGPKGPLEWGAEMFLKALWFSYWIKAMRVKLILTVTGTVKTKSSFLIFTQHFVKMTQNDFLCSLSPACVEPAGRGSAAGGQSLPRSSPGPLSGGLMQPLDVWATAPWGGCVGGGRAGVVSEVHSRGIAGREPAWWCRRVCFCSAYLYNMDRTGVAHTC